MGLGECLVLGVALAMDAFAVTVSNTLAAPGARRRRLLLMPLLFGLFQGLMTLLGSLLGSLFGDVIERFSGLVALVVLGAIGVNMVREGLGAMRPVAAEEVAAKGSPAEEDRDCGTTSSPPAGSCSRPSPRPSTPLPWVCRSAPWAWPSGPPPRSSAS